MFQFNDRHGNPLKFTPFTAESKNNKMLILAQPGAGQVLESRKSWLNRIIDNPETSAEVLLIAKTELGKE